MRDLGETLRGCEKWLDRYRGRFKSVSEQDTKAGLIEPVLEALGWDVRDPDEVRHEYRRAPSDNPVDYALLLLRTPRLFVEAKGVSQHLDDPKWANQTIAYATAAGVEWVALTNGAEWRIYNAHAPVPIDKKLFRSVQIEKDPDEAVRVLRLLGKENMGENRIEELWKGYFVDRQVHEVLLDIFSSEPARELVAAVRHRVPSLTPKEIRASLTRVVARFEFPAVAETPATGDSARHLVPEVAVVGTLTAAPPKRPGYRRVRVSSSERSESLADLIALGVLIAGATLEASYFGERHTAELLGDGRVEYAGKIYGSLSGAGEAVKHAVRGDALSDKTRSTDGWRFWRTKERDTGKLATLKEIRGGATSPGLA